MIAAVLSVAGSLILSVGGTPTTATAATAALATAAPAPAARPSPEATAVELVQRARVAAGRPRLAWASDLGAVAERHAARMAARQSIYHNANISREICCWRSYGENVGTSIDVQRLHNAFMASSGHRNNIVNPRWREVGIGVVQGADGRVYEVQVFRQRR